MTGSLHFWGWLFQSALATIAGYKRSLPFAAAGRRCRHTCVLRDWLSVFAGFVREVDYRQRGRCFTPTILAFGTHRDVITGLAAGRRPNGQCLAEDIGFGSIPTRHVILVSADLTMATVVVPWTSTGYEKDGATFDRPARTMVFNKEERRLALLPTHTCRSIAACRSRAMPTGPVKSA